MANLKLQTGAGGLPAAPNALGLADLIIVGQSGGLATTGTSYRSNFTDAKALVLAGLTAANVANVPAGNISATNVQAAIAELDAEKAGLALANTFTAAQTVSLNATAPPTPLAGTVLNIVGVDATTSRVALETFGAVGLFYTRRANGTNASKSQILNTNQLFQFQAYGYGATGYGGGTVFLCSATQDWTDTAQGRETVFYSTSNASAAPQGRWTIQQDGALNANAATGSAGANGAINAVNYLVNGVNINAIYAGLAAANVFTAAQTINLNGSAIPTPPTGTALQIGALNSTTNGVQLDSFGSPNAITGRRANGTNASKTAVAADANLLIINGSGYGDTGYFNNRAQIGLNAQQLWTDSANGTYIAFEATPNGSTSRAEVARFAGGLGLQVAGNTVVDTAALLRTRAYTVGTLPTAAGVVGAIARVTDALAAPVYAAAATGGGTTFAKVVSDGTIWRYG